MKIRHLLAWMLAATAIVACKQDDIVPEDPEANAVAFSVKYSEITEGVAKPESVALTIDNKEMQVSDGKFYKTDLAEKESYMVAVYNKMDNVSVNDGVISLNGSGSTVPSVGWLFCYAGEKKLDKSLSVTLQQQTQQINVVVRAVGGKTGSVSEVTAEMTEVAGQRDIINKVYKGASTVSVKMEQGVLTGTFFGTLRVLGFMADAASALKLNFKYADGTTSTTTVDISTQTEAFNEDKTVINVINVSIGELGEAAETASCEFANNGTLENKDNTEAAPEGANKLTINWPSYNTASRIEVKADGKYFVGELEAATEAGQTTKNGFGELPAADKIEEIAIYVGTERLIAPKAYYTYANGVITMTDCKLVYKPEHMNDTYITKDGTFVQTVDIKLPGDFAPIGAEWKFAGTYDGQEFSITGLNKAEATANFALFRYNAGTIKNVVIKDSKIVSAGYCAGIASKNDGSVINCISYADFEVTAAGHTGGIVGQHNKGMISRCQFHGTIKVTAAGLSGGISGTCYNGATIEYCLNTGVINYPVAGGACGGIVGRNRGLVRGCKNTASHTFSKGSQYNGNGGVAGRNDNNTGVIIACVNTGTITGTEGFGGIVGVTEGATGGVAGEANIVRACYNTGLIVDGGSAGLVGKVAGWFAGRNATFSVIQYGFTVSEGQPKTSNGVFGNGLLANVDIQKFEEAWPEADASKGWGIYTEGCDPTQGYYWKSLGNKEKKEYPVLFWE